MGLFAHLSQVVRSHLHELISNSENPEPLIEQFFNDMQEDLFHLRAAVAKAMATKKVPKITGEKQEKKASKWEKNLEFVLTKHQKNIEQENLYRQKADLDTEISWEQAPLELSIPRLDSLKYHLTALESKIFSSKVHPNLLQSLLPSDPIPAENQELEVKESSSIKEPSSSLTPETVVDPEIAKLLSELDKI